MLGVQLDKIKISQKGSLDFFFPTKKQEIFNNLIKLLNIIMFNI